jgi:hypothetical protein
MNIEEFIAGIETHDKLNPKIWKDEDTIRPEVRRSLLNIAREFYDFLDIQVIIIDIIVTGSQANYLYTDASDLDLHLIVPYGDVDCEGPVRELFDAKRKLWKENHNITIRDIPVETYVEDEQQPVTGSSYSLLKDKWVRKPEVIQGPIPTGIESQVTAWTQLVRLAISHKDLESLVKIKDLLSSYRKAGLRRGGELDPANIVFKTLRNNNVISMLMKSVNRLKDNELSIQD